jgi:hypothetical protein
MNEKKKSLLRLWIAKNRVTVSYTGERGHEYVSSVPVPGNRYYAHGATEEIACRELVRLGYVNDWRIP